MTSVTTPDFICILVSDKPKFDCYFKVGNENQGKPERIGAVKLMLMAHSEVFRAELEFSELKEKEDVPVKDIHPDTFRGMLKYVYGHDTTKEMIFEEADNLLYVAEKYLMKTFKNKLALRLMKLLNYDNICSLLNNPACYTHLELNAAITDILRRETDRILASAQFLWMNAEGFLRILEQEELAVKEIELWRAAISWAKHRADSEDSRAIRQQLSGLTQHLRLCTLTAEEVCAEIVPTDVLNKDELSAVCQSVGRKRKAENLRDISDETIPRKLLKRSRKEHRGIEFPGMYQHENLDYGDYNFILQTRGNSVELVCRSIYRCFFHQSTPNLTPGSWDQACYKVHCTTILSKVEDPNELPMIAVASVNVKYETFFSVPLNANGRNITLQPNTKYRVKMVLIGGHKLFRNDDSGRYKNDHLSVRIVKNNQKYEIPAIKLEYNVVTPPE